MKAWTDETIRIEVCRAESGWIIRRQKKQGSVMGEDVAGIADDEGLVEWFQEQLGFDGHKRTISSEEIGRLELKLDTSTALANLEAVRLKAIEVGDLWDKLQARSPNPGPEAKPAEAAIASPPVQPTQTQVQHMVDRFLSWRLPDDFAPDGGVTLKPSYDPEHARGTNLFDASQAEAMVLHMLEGLPGSAATAPPPVNAELIDAVRPFQAWAVDACDKSDDAIAWNTYEPGNVGSYREVSFGQLRALIRAAGLWTDEMQAAPAQAVAPSATPVAADTTQPQADVEDEIEHDERLAREEF